ncbi:MAG: hypothetical protein AAGU27_27375, partial [Dehalobacterium sp.]
DICFNKHQALLLFSSQRPASIVYQTISSLSTTLFSSSFYLPLSRALDQFTKLPLLSQWLFAWYLLPHFYALLVKPALVGYYTLPTGDMV